MHAGNSSVCVDDRQRHAPEMHVRTQCRSRKQCAQYCSGMAVYGIDRVRYDRIESRGEAVRLASGHHQQQKMHAKEALITDTERQTSSSGWIDMVGCPAGGSII